jgi:hypothetical protein
MKKCKQCLRVSKRTKRHFSKNPAPYPRRSDRIASKNPAALTIVVVIDRYGWCVNVVRMSRIIMSQQTNTKTFFTLPYTISFQAVRLGHIKLCFTRSNNTPHMVQCLLSKKGRGIRMATNPNVGRKVFEGKLINLIGMKFIVYCTFDQRST